ncbi:DSD1 family PLP-dependent enzyme [Parvibaculaceae bacterium PLY_AMNH_Bact1]|nr:DSD1 family PLP-dependent enzyme [Parvibaculaceae bacterium PLY_AMNH_Bact1]
MSDFINRSLVGAPGSRGRIATPALVIDLPAFKANLNAMATHCETHGLNLRPHAKTHKCAEIARLQISAGALGICCAKLGEAEALAAESIDGILLTSPVVQPFSVERLMRLNAKLNDLMVAVDNPENATSLAAAAEAAGKPLQVLMDLDVGLHRTGITPGDEAHALARQMEESPHLHFKGLQAYAGHLMHIEDFAERREKSLAVMDMLRDMRDQLEEDGITCKILSGGGTGTFDIDVEANVLTELQGGSYVFMDKQYNDVNGADGSSLESAFQTSLFVQMSVVSNNTPRLATTDAGFKSFSTDAEPPVLSEGAPDDAKYFFFGDEQGGIMLSSANEKLALGSTLTAVTPHCDPTVNLYDAYHVMDGDRLVGIWPIEARGRSA